MTKKELLHNQILTDIKFWLENYGMSKDDEATINFEPVADDAANIMAKMKNYLTMGDEE